jgi:hypothetical protein
MFGLREKFLFVALILFTTIAWILAVNSAMSLSSELGEFTRGQIGTTAPAESESPDTTSPAPEQIPFGGAIAGLVGGLVGGAVTVFGISIVNSRFRRVQDLLPVIVAATVLGGLLQLWAPGKANDLPLLLLFVVWQTAVIVLIAKALAANPTDLVT